MSKDKEKGKHFDLERSGSITLYLLNDVKRLLIAFDVDERGLSKTGVNGLSEALKKTREQMVR
jgi:hypothetical protein